MQMSNTYLALTIGPIYKTLSQAHRTREVWGSSYLFSWLMREIIVKLITAKTVKAGDILMPHRDKHDNLKKGTGLYHDRMIVKIEPEKKDQALKDFKESADTVLSVIVSKTDVSLDVLKSYFRLNVVLFDLEDDKNIVETVTNYLDSLELQNPIFHNSWQIDWSDAIDKLNGKVFYKDAFAAGGDFGFVFDSIPEIASQGLSIIKPELYKKLVKIHIKDKFLKETKLSKKSEFESHDEFIQELSKPDAFKADFRNYHKYIAIVHADGDNLGETIREIGHNAVSVGILSEALFSFASKATDEIRNYGGTNVYAGGDDLLFFAPVAVAKAEIPTIFHLIDTLDELFKKEVSEKPKLTTILAEPKPTLSWGVSISYYKFPLSEAIVSSRELLFNEAKEFDGKNAVAFKFIKHSGQTFGTTFGKNKDDYKVHFKNLLKQAFNPDIEFISSLQYRISENMVLLTELFSLDNYEEKIENFFDNFFDEEIHSSKKGFVHAVRDMLVQSFMDIGLPKDYSTLKDEEKEKAHTKRVKTAVEKTYAALRFIHFLNSKSDE